MPVNIPDHLPAAAALANENIFTMERTSAVHQDIRPLKIAILNLMPLKQSTELNLLRLLSNNPLQIEVDLVRTSSYVSRNSDPSHLNSFYKTFDEIKFEYYDGMIFTGAPVEHLEFSEVDYWDEMKNLMDWAAKHVTSTLFICWAAQAGLFHHFEIPKYTLNKKLFGVFDHRVVIPKHQLLRGFDDVFLVPHSRYTAINREDINKCPSLELLSYSDTAGVHIVEAKELNSFFITGHSEYDSFTLKEEYVRDSQKGLDIKIPQNYFPGNDPSRQPVVSWRSHANLLFSNWLNFFVYQETPYDLKNLPNLSI